MKDRKAGRWNNGSTPEPLKKPEVIGTYETVVHGQSVTVTRYASKPRVSPPIAMPSEKQTKYITIEELLEREAHDE